MLRRAAVASAVGLAAMLGVTSLAWACAFKPPVLEPDATQAEVGTAVTVNGAYWETGAPVMLALSPDGATISHPLATASPSDSHGFAAQVRVPDAAAGVYYLTAVQGSVRASTPFEVLAPSSTDGPSSPKVSGADLWSGDATALPGSFEPDATPGSTRSGAALGAMAFATGLAATATFVGVDQLRRRHITTG